MNVIISACLLGINCRCDGSSSFNKKIFEFLKKNALNPIPICPEQLGGLPTPRKKSEINGDGFSVLKGLGKVYTEDGNDVTSFFIKGANEALKIAKTLKVNIAILKSLSPSCGVGEIYDGTFSKKIKEGYGVTSALLLLNDIEIFNENSILEKANEVLNKFKK
jgi:uncharacterized protein YbbK (DUF523 family)